MGPVTPTMTNGCTAKTANTTFYSLKSTAARQGLALFANAQSLYLLKTNYNDLFSEHVASRKVNLTTRHYPRAF
jgi:hypothetical protein